MLKGLFKKAALSLFLLGLLLLAPGEARAEMANNLTNEACLTCHKDYPAINQGGTYTIKHKWNNCGTCHTNKALDSMWNCRFCHVDLKFKGGSSFWLHKSPTLSEGMNRHTTDYALRYITASFVYHNNNMNLKHTSTAASECLGCHQSNLMAEHNGGTQLLTEDLEDTTYSLQFTGSWYRYNLYPDSHSGSYSLRSPAIGDNASTSVDTSVYLAQAGKISFWYRVSSEANYDKFYFYLDGAEKLGGISGNVGWCQVTYPLTAGTHTLKWEYVKDQYTKWFNDSVYLDDITVSLGGRAFDCNTCHTSQNPDVKTAITNHNTGCTACHKTVDHETVHATNMNQSCLASNCHNSSLSIDHKQRSIDCSGCHNSAKPQVKNAIGNSDQYCGSCHESAHALKLTPLLPGFPLYEGFQWSSAMPLSLWGSENWVPAELATKGYVITSNRRNDVNADTVWTFYKDQMSLLGWTLQSPEPQAGSSDFRVTYSKSEKQCIIWFHNLEDHNQAPVPDNGYKIEIFYN